MNSNNRVERYPHASAAPASEYLHRTGLDAAVMVPTTTSVRTVADGLTRIRTASHHDSAQAPLSQTSLAEDVDLRSGIDPGDPLTGKGRIKKRTRDKEVFDPDDPDRYRYKAYHIRRAFDLYGHIPTIINEGIKRRAKESAGEDVSRIQSDRDYETFKLIVSHLEGLNDDIVRFKRHPKLFRALVRKIREAADQARNNDTANLKKDIGCMLSPDGSSVLTIIAKGKKASSKHDRGFENDVMGRYLCPISLDWDNSSVRHDIRDGKYAILASDWPRLLYANCDCNLDDLEVGLGRNMALVRVVKYLFTGRSAAFSETPGGKTTRSGNAALAGMTEVSPRVVAYAACMLRYAISNEESWSSIDKEFNMHEFYWNVVSIFDDAEEFGRDLLAWWNIKIFGTSTTTSLKPDAPPVTATISLLRTQRHAKRAAKRILCDVTNLTENNARENATESEDEGNREQPGIQAQDDTLNVTEASRVRQVPGTNQTDTQTTRSRSLSPSSPHRPIDPHMQHTTPSQVYSQTTAYQTHSYFDPHFSHRGMTSALIPYHPRTVNTHPNPSQNQASSIPLGSPCRPIQSLGYSLVTGPQAYQGGPPPPPWYYAVAQKVNSSSADTSSSSTSVTS